jgi:hypothetical protein
MPVLTAQEYETYQKSGSLERGVKPLPLPVIPEERKQDIEYWLLYPEIEQGGNLPSFEDVIKIDGIDYLRKCERGIVKTKYKPLYEFLKKKGYELMYKERVE